MTNTERWATRVGLVLAMAGNAVGLGNFLRFPAQAAKNGGGAFLIPYIVALLLLGLPLMWVEWTMGRYGGQFGQHSTPGILQSMGRSKLWKYMGVMGLWSCLIVASYYVYIESWTLAYSWHSLTNGFAAESGHDYYMRLVGEKPNEVMSISGWGMGIFAVCIVLNVFILSKGLAKGIEIVAKIGMPILILFAAVLAVRGLMIDPATDANAVTSPMEGLNFVWEPRFDKLSSPSVWLAAAGQIFFTLSIGMGSIHCFASYLRRKDDVALTGATTAWTNEFCEVVLGGAILIPIGVAYLGLQGVQDRVAGGSGFGLGFMVFPELFRNWGAFAPVAGFMWFGLLFFAAITSSLAMGQPIMAFLQDNFGFTRGRAALAFGAMLTALAVPVAIFHEMSFNGEFDYFAGSFMLVVFAFVEIVLFSWVFGIGKGWAELNEGAELKVPLVFRFIMKWVTPLLLLVILLSYTFEPAAGWEAHLASWFGSAPAPEWGWSGNGLIGKLLHEDIQIAATDAPERVAFLENIKLLRNIDRLVMVAVYAFFCWLVARAWRRREAAAGSMS
jgi:neurotransmitter:Na+ symporter, NSS family